MPTAVPDPHLAAIRLITTLNAGVWTAASRVAGTTSAVGVSDDVAAAQVVGPDAAHHLVDQASLLGLDPFHATELVDGWSTLTAAETDGWFLSLPRPGALGALRGPTETNQRAIASGAAVISPGAGVALLPEVVGAGVQWLVMPAARPATPPSPYEAERAMTETVLAATREMQRLDVAGGVEPRSRTVRLPGPYDQRRQASLDRAVRMFTACRAALDDDGGSISSHQVLQRRATVAPLVGLSADVIVAICSAPPTSGAPS